MKQQIVPIIIFIFMTASAAYPQNDDPFKRVKSISDFVEHGLGISLAVSDANIRNLGRVKKVAVEQYEDRGIVMEKRTYSFDGLQVVANFAKGKDSGGGITEAVVTGPKWKIYKKLGVGASIDSVVKTLGEPTSKSEKTYKYCGETGVDCATFEISKNKVVKITFTYYWD
jgi:hypothetical protein